MCESRNDVFLALVLETLGLELWVWCPPAAESLGEWCLSLWTSPLGMRRKHRPTPATSFCFIDSKNTISCIFFKVPSQLQLAQVNSCLLA